ncbi:MAG: hypothetical protein ACK45A_05195 [Planctomyces sp.]
MLLRFLWNRVQDGFYWPAFAGVGIAVFLAIRTPSPKARWTLRGSLLIALDLLLLTASIITGSDWLCAAGVFCLMASLAISCINRTETADFSYLLTYPLMLLSVPAAVSQVLWPRLLNLQTSLTSYAATRQGLHHFQQDSQLSVLTGSVDMERITGGIFSWQALVLIVLFWGSLQRRSCIQAALMMPVVLVTGFAANMASGIVLLSMMGGPGGTSPSAAMYLLTTLLMLLPTLLFVLSAEAAMVGLTAPIPLQEPADSDEGKAPSLRSLCSPLVYWWNSLVSSMPMDPLPCQPLTDFRIPRPLRAVCLWLSPVVVTAQCIRLIF